MQNYIFRNVSCLCVFGLQILVANEPMKPQSGIIERQLEKEYEEKSLELKQEIPAIEEDAPKKNEEIIHEK